MDMMDDIKFEHKYVLWCHDINNKNWDLSSYNEMYVIDDVASFWRVFNNISKFDYHNRHFYLMKEGITPMWEDSNNKNGGVCSFRTLLSDSLELFENLSVHMICDLLSSDPKDITGVIFSPKNSWAIVKIWNRDSKKDLTKMINQEILDKYSKLSIQYKSHELS